jgi:ATP-dependent protease ClpP protease subunit
VDAATLGAVGTIVVGLAAATAALVGHRGANTAQQSGVVITGSLGLVNELQEERDKAHAKIAENERLLAAAYADLAGERADKARLQAEIAELTAENTRLRSLVVELGGQPT